MTGTFERATATIDDLPDAASAQPCADAERDLDRLGGLAGELPAQGKSALAALINGALPELEALVARVTEIPGVADEIGPVANGLMDKLRAMAA